MIARLSILIILFGLLGIPVPYASSSDSQKMLESINTQLKSTDEPKAKAKLYCYRARSYTKSGEHEKAKDDYLKALNTSYEGWILEELGYLMYKLGEYEKAYNVSVKLENDFPYLDKEANELKTLSKKKWEEEFSKNHPPTITIDTVPAPNRITRHELSKQSQMKHGNHYSGGKQINKPNQSGYKYWGTHPKTKNIPIPKQRNINY